MSNLEPAPEHARPPILSTDEVVGALLRGTLANVPGFSLVAELVGLGVVVAGRLDRMRETADEMAREAGGAEPLLDGLRKSVRTEVVALRALEAGSDSYDEAKRRLLGRVVGRAVLDDARIDESEMIVFALREMDAPHARALEELRRVEDSSARTPEEPYEPERVSEELAETSRRYPVPIVATLIRVGVVIPATVVGGGVAVFAVSDFGRALLQQLRDQ